MKTLSRLLLILALLAFAASQGPVDAKPSKPKPTEYSVWLVESSTFKDVPAGAFMPDRAFVPGSTNPQSNQVFFQLPVNVGIIKGGGEVILYDTGWKQQDYIAMTNSINWHSIVDQLAELGIHPSEVTKLVIGHGHWDHAGQLDDFPNGVLYVQREELRGIEWAINYPNPRISAVNTDPGGCQRTPACGYPPRTLDQIYGKVLGGMAVIVNGTKTIGPGLTIHPAHRAHTAGSQLLQVNTRIGQLVFGSDAYSSWEAIRDWQVANVQQTDTVQQFLAYEKCYILTGGFNNCVAAHEPLSYSAGYPLTANWWQSAAGRMAEIVLAPGEPSRVP